jgi:dTDP-4-dehydrorhamnose 3,5-epimerase
MYLTTNEYAPEFERSVSWGDPEIGIDWPIGNPTLSSRDNEAPPLGNVKLE